MTDNKFRRIALEWLNEDDDPQTRRELEQLLEMNDESMLAERFGSRLQFGTAGLRGLLGCGTNRMNRLMVRKTTAGLADYLKRTVENACGRGVVVGYDARQNSDVFAHDAVKILLGSGFKVYLFEGLVPTPLVSFGTSELSAAAGIMITASHNPPEYNGYKVFWETGGQIVPPHDEGISSAIDAVGPTDQLMKTDFEKALKDKCLIHLGNDFIEEYMKGLRKLSIHPEAPGASKLVTAYTPLHGVGSYLTEKAFEEAGFLHVHVVEEQREPDGSFPTVNLPNPEEEGTMDAVISLGRRTGADIAIAADPDADRLGVALPEKDSDAWRMLGGDDTGVILAHYLLNEGGGGKERLLASTIVSSRMLSAMARHHDVHYVDTLTGLKWIIDASLKHREKFNSRLVLGYENALGYTVGELVRDKDGISAALIFAEMAAWLKTRNMTVWDYFDEAYRTYGLFLTQTTSLVFEPDQMACIEEMMELVRKSPPEKLGSKKVLSMVDLSGGSAELPPSNLLLFNLEHDARILMRPSGTEPKLKSYYEVRETVDPDEPVSAARARACSALDELERTHQEYISGS